MPYETSVKMWRVESSEQDILFYDAKNPEASHGEDEGDSEGEGEMTLEQDAGTVENSEQDMTTSGVTAEQAMTTTPVLSSLDSSSARFSSVTNPRFSVYAALVTMIVIAGYGL